MLNIWWQQENSLSKQKHWSININVDEQVSVQKDQNCQSMNISNMLVSQQLQNLQKCVKCVMNAG